MAGAGYANRHACHILISMPLALHFDVDQTCGDNESKDRCEYLARRPVIAFRVPRLRFPGILGPG